MSIELVLMTVVIVAGAIAASTAFRQNEYFAKLVSGPWVAISGLIQNGVWGSPSDTMVLHPNHVDRVNTVKGQPF